jgi:dihydroorotate dehydrogenase
LKDSSLFTTNGSRLMKTLSTYLRHMIYPLIRELLFCFPPEDVHYFSMNMLKAGCRMAPLRSIIQKQFSFSGNGLQKNVFGLSFQNPVGLGAGFDKNALYLTELDTLGFGFVEIGTVTPKPQVGNDKPRLFRLQEGWQIGTIQNSKFKIQN